MQLPSGLNMLEVVDAAIASDEYRWQILSAVFAIWFMGLAVGVVLGALASARSGDGRKNAIKFRIGR